MSEASAALARQLAMLSYARRSRKRRGAWVNDRILQTLVADLVGARVAAGMTQQQVARRMWTTRSAVSRLESGRYARPTLDTIEKYTSPSAPASRFAYGELISVFVPRGDVRA